MATKQDIKKAKEFANTMAGLDSDGILTPKGQAPINIKSKYYKGYIAACDEKNKEIAKYKKYSKRLLSIFDFVKWITKNEWKQASEGWYHSENGSTNFKTTEELFEMFLKKKNGRTKSKRRPS